MDKLDRNNWAASIKHGLNNSPQSDSVTERSSLMHRTVDLLIEKSKASEYWPEFYVCAVGVLESLPLATDEFALAAKRLQNAHEYSTQWEFRAAAFELRMLRGQLAKS